MNNAGLDHAERFDAMKKEVDGRVTHWYFDTGKENKRFEGALFEGLTGTTMPVGPFELDYFTNEFMGIPRMGKRSSKVHDEDHDVLLAMVATNSSHTNTTRYAWDASKSITTGDWFTSTPSDILAACIQLAETVTGEMIVVSASLFRINYMSAYYEHPSNLRLLLAMNDQLFPEWSACVFRCTEASGLDLPQAELNERLTNIYNNRLIDYVDDETFKQQIFNPWNK